MAITRKAPAATAAAAVFLCSATSCDSTPWGRNTLSAMTRPISSRINPLPAMMAVMISSRPRSLPAPVRAVRTISPWATRKAPKLMPTAGLASSSMLLCTS